MVRVTPHTTKVGYSVETRISTWTRTLNGSNPRDMVSNVTTGIHFRSSTHKSDGKQPTSYSRCIVRAASKKSVDATDNLGWRVKGDSSFHASGLRMDPTPWGQTGLSTGVVSPSEYLRTNAILDAKNRLHGNQANILEDLAQVWQFAKDIGSLYNSICRATSKYYELLVELYDSVFLGPYSRKRRGGPRRHASGDELLNRLARAWLVWYYAVKPAVSSINAIAAKAQPRSVTITSEAKQSAVLDPAGLFDIWLGSGTTVTGDCKEEVRVKLTVVADLSNDLVHLMNLGFHPQAANTPTTKYSDMLDSTDILTTAWAIVPYSFVFDWLIPVESFLRSMYWSPSIEYKYGYVTTYMGGEASASLTKMGYGNTSSGSKPSGVVRANLSQRVAYLSFPPPSSLAVNQSISPSNLISAAALVKTRM